MISSFRTTRPSTLPSFHFSLFFKVSLISTTVYVEVLDRCASRWLSFVTYSSIHRFLNWCLLRCKCCVRCMMLSYPSRSSVASSINVAGSPLIKMFRVRGRLSNSSLTFVSGRLFMKHSIFNNVYWIVYWMWVVFDQQPTALKESVLPRGSREIKFIFNSLCGKVLLNIVIPVCWNVLVLLLIINLGPPRRATNSFSDRLKHLGVRSPDHFKCTALVVAQVKKWYKFHLFPSCWSWSTWMQQNPLLRLQRDLKSRP